MHLVSVSFDPLTDTPPCSRSTRRQLGADPSCGRFLTGDRDEIDQFASRSACRSRAPSTTRATSRTTCARRSSIAEGKLVKIYTGNEWTPEQVLARSRVMVGV